MPEELSLRPTKQSLSCNEIASRLPTFNSLLIKQSLAKTELFFSPIKKSLSGKMGEREVLDQIQGTSRRVQA